MQSSQKEMIQIRVRNQCNVPSLPLLEIISSSLNHFMALLLLWPQKCIIIGMNANNVVGLAEVYLHEGFRIRLHSPFKELPDVIGIGRRARVDARTRSDIQESFANLITICTLWRNQSVGGAFRKKLRRGKFHSLVQLEEHVDRLLPILVSHEEEAVRK